NCRVNKSPDSLLDEDVHHPSILVDFDFCNYGIKLGIFNSKFNFLNFRKADMDLIVETVSQLIGHHYYCALTLTMLPCFSMRCYLVLLKVVYRFRSDIKVHHLSHRGFMVP
ncbi:hypothetical protein BDFB_011825, partial [Asbolus verrucosus]